MVYSREAGLKHKARLRVIELELTEIFREIYTKDGDNYSNRRAIEVITSGLATAITALNCAVPDLQVGPAHWDKQGDNK